jgi:Flp pilus assembly protein TadD
MTLTLVRNEDFCDPVRMYRELLLLFPENGRAWNNLGTTLGRQQKCAEAIEAFRKARQYPHARHPAVERFAWLNLIGATAECAPRELLPILRDYAAADPENPSRRFLLANARFDAHDPVGAVADYRAAIDIATRNGYPLREPMVYGFYGQALIDSGDFEGAVAVLNHALTFDRQPPSIHNMLGQVLTRLGRYAEAEPHLRAASEQAPKVPNGPYNLGILRMYQGNPADAANWFREAIRRDRDHLWATLGLAQALHESGQPGEAKKEFAKARVMAGNWPQVAVAQAWRMVGDPEPRARYATEGSRLARLLVDQFGENDPGALDIWAAALAETGQFEEAERTAKRAVDAARSGGKTKPELVTEMEARRLLYASKQPYRQPIAPH